MGRFLALRGGNLLPNLPPSTGAGTELPPYPARQDEGPILGGVGVLVVVRFSNDNAIRRLSVNRP